MDKKFYNFRDNYYFYCLALYEFNLQNFENSLELISKIKYDEYQLKAIDGATKSSFMVITGGPGTGKTTVIKAIISIFIKAGLKSGIQGYVLLIATSY